MRIVTWRWEGKRVSWSSKSDSHALRARFPLIRGLMPATLNHAGEGILSQLLSTAQPTTNFQSEIRNVAIGVSSLTYARTRQRVLSHHAGPHPMYSLSRLLFNPLILANALARSQQI
jgi:hypothetical protein